MKMRNARVGVAITLAGLVLSACSSSSTVTSEPNTSSGPTTSPTLTAVPTVCDVIPKEQVESIVHGTVIQAKEGLTESCHYSTQIDTDKDVTFDVALETVWVPSDDAEPLLLSDESYELTLMPQLGPDAYLQSDRTENKIRVHVLVEGRDMSLTTTMIIITAGELTPGMKESALNLTKAFLSELSV